ncbi:molybdopterin-dependent oxidoreductase [Variovorax sp. J22R133]|uniref:molybdopterin-dependent oxidoreductase n=1 Tax=Variovorax brevis TaxID=3053503 RepID=UPI0025790E96|nr:molybdopterin-dependent oxidoreductase [Variovorax sp. J22R133]MDM0116779.1 molybdopterin-dependent oxidoreductase [Variovorax sp. J22R133]
MTQFTRFPGRTTAAIGLLTAAALTMPSLATAAPNSCPTDALLEIAGAVKSNSPRGSFLFSEKDLLKLKTVTLTTATAWTPRSEFVGPELSTVLQAAGVPATAKEMRFYAIDAYEITISTGDLVKYRPVMAHTQNGQRLEVATRGPVFLVYPRDQYPELTAIKGQAQFVWMVCKIVVK